MEKPNLNYINKLARGDDAVKENLLSVIKSEFPEDLLEYKNCVASKNFKNIEDVVHKIKHKFSILGLEKSYQNAVALEICLREEDFDKQKKEDFEAALQSITEFIKIV